MKNSTKQLNEIIRSLSKENAVTSVNQLASIIDECLKAGIRISVYEDYKNELASFTAGKFPEWNAEVTNVEIESLAKDGKYDQAAEKRDEAISLKNEVLRQFRLSKFGSEDWFIANSEGELIFVPTEIAVVDGLVNDEV